MRWMYYVGAAVGVVIAGWSGVGLYLHPEDRPAATARAAQSVRLILRAPITTALPFTGLPPVPGMTQWRAPRYPDLRSRTRGLPEQDDLIQPYVVPAYRRSAARAFWTSASMGEVNRWYAHAAWVDFALVNATSVTTVTPVVDLRIYRPRHARPGQVSRLEIALRPSQGGTLVQYWAIDVVAPPRPADTYLSPPFARVTVTVTRQTTPKAPQLRTTEVRDPTIIARLVHLVNGLRWGRTLGPMPGPTLGGFPIVPETATLIFLTKSGHAVTVFTTNKTGAVRMHGIELGDVNEGLLRAALALDSPETTR